MACARKGTYLKMEIFDANQKKWKHLSDQTLYEYQVFVGDDSDHWFGIVNMPQNLTWQDMPDSIIMNGFKYIIEIE